MAVPRKQLTPALLQHLKPPARGVIELWDMQARGLCLRVFASGRASWNLWLPGGAAGHRRFCGSGRFRTCGLSEARRRAERHRGVISDGGDPQGERQARRAAVTFRRGIAR